MNIIVAVDRNWAIGCKGNLLVRIPADHKNFRELTTGRVVVLGRKTLETFPQGLPLKNRTNIIMSKDPSYEVRDAIVVHSTDELMDKLKYEADAYFPNLDDDPEWELKSEGEEMNYFDLEYTFRRYERKK